VGGQLQVDVRNLCKGIADREEQRVLHTWRQRLVDVDVAQAALRLRGARLGQDHLDAPMTRIRGDPNDAAGGLAAGRNLHFDLAHRLKGHADAKVRDPEFQGREVRVDRVLVDHGGA
jgi:hypothetical protein